MARRNWDKARTESLARRHGSEYLRSEAERYTGLQHDRKRDVKGGLKYCHHCDDPVTLEGLRAHILKYHRSSQTRPRRLSAKARKQGQVQELKTCPECGTSVRNLQKHFGKAHGGSPVTPRVKAPARKAEVPPEPTVSARPYHVNLFFVQRTKAIAAEAGEILRRQSATVTLRQVKDDALSAGFGDKVYYFEGTTGSPAGAQAIRQLLKGVCRLSVGFVSLGNPSSVPYAIWLTK
jgi:hypothetical protein